MEQLEKDLMAAREELRAELGKVPALKSGQEAQQAAISRLQELQQGQRALGMERQALEREKQELQKAMTDRTP